MMDRPSKSQLLACFDLPPSATFEESREAWKDMCIVWHPDRFEDHPRLRGKAEQAMREVNAAWRLLRELFDDGGGR
jgi:curved DNA-binding protein CbpA